MIYGRIYLITNSANGMQYVGQTTRSIAKRWCEHRASDGYCRALYAAIVKHGVEKFSIVELAAAESRYELDRIETEWIARIGSVSPRGYNLRTGGGSNGTFADETKAICRDIQKARMSDPKLREIAVAGFKRIFASPDAMRKREEAKKLARALPENREKERAGKLASWARDPDRRIRMSQQAKARGNDPVFMAKWKATVEESTHSPEKRKKNSDASNANWADPAYRAKSKASRQRPEVKAARVEIAKACWLDPEFRKAQMEKRNSPEWKQKHSEAVKAGQAARRLSCSQTQVSQSTE